MIQYQISLSNIWYNIKYPCLICDTISNIPIKYIIRYQISLSNIWYNIKYSDQILSIIWFEVIISI